MIFDEYFKKYLGVGIDFDNAYSYQCFDLANDFAVKVLGTRPFIGMWAYEIYTNFKNQPDNDKYTLIPNTPDYVPIKGDIVIWAKSLNGSAGHVAIASGEGTTTWFKSYEQNWTGRNDPVTLIKHNYNHVLGCLRIKDQSKITGKTVTDKTTTKSSSKSTSKELPILDVTGFKKGDKGLEVLAVKKLLLIAKSKKIIKVTIDSTSGYGEGCMKAANFLLNKWKYQETGIIGTNFINKLYEDISKS